jgi:hypothetical protein
MSRSSSLQYLLVPGLGNSGPDHWQSLWEREPQFARVELGDWDAPDRERWIARLDAAVAAAGPVVLVAHSLGCLAVAWWAANADPVLTDRVAGALMVAPPDVERADAPVSILSFAPAPCKRLPFPARLVASDDDPYATLAAQHAMATAWGATFEPLGSLGHINAQSGLNAWPAGRAELDALLLRA